MLENIKHTSVYRSLNLNKCNTHAYLFYSNDLELNNNVALCFAKQLVCNTSNACNSCSACSQFNSNSHPDVTIIDQASVKVDDINKILSKTTTLPILNQVKVFVILNAENVNEIAQNKLLKSLEEPNSSCKFILTCSKTDKLLPTIMSRLTKIYVPKLTKQDKEILQKELSVSKIDVSKYINCDITLTEILNFETNDEYKSTIKAIENMFNTLKSSSDIPKVVDTLKNVNKSLFLPLLQDIFIDCLNKNNKFEKQLTMLVNVHFSQKALIKCIDLVNEYYKKQISNVNFSYILDNLLFNILKEKFLCK